MAGGPPDEGTPYKPELHSDRTAAGCTPADLFEQAPKWMWSYERQRWEETD